jgi:hypothetical protein
MPDRALQFTNGRIADAGITFSRGSAIPAFTSSMLSRHRPWCRCPSMMLCQVHFMCNGGEKSKGDVVMKQLFINQLVTWIRMREDINGLQWCVVFTEEPRCKLCNYLQCSVISVLFCLLCHDVHFYSVCLLSQEWGFYSALLSKQLLQYSHYLICAGL